MNMLLSLADSRPLPGRDLLHQLPNELLLEILKECRDFSSVWGLINSSPRLSSIFDDSALNIVETVVESVVAPPIQSLMRAVVHIRSRSLEYQTWEDARDFALAPGISAPLSPAASPAILRKFVGLAYKIHVLAHLCINRCFQRCLLISMRPVPCMNPFHSHPFEGGKHLCNRGCKGFRAKDLGRPSWDEKQRAILAFWRVQYFFELKIGRLKGRLGWTSHDLGKLQFARIENFYSGFERQQALTALESVEDLRTTCPVAQLPEPCSFGWSCSQRQFQLPDPPKVVESGWNCKAHLPFRAVGQDQCTHKRDCVLAEPTSWRFLKRIVKVPWTDPLRYLPLDPYRKFGVFLWGQKMMANLGLLPDRDFLNYKDGEDYFHSWRILLSEDEVARAVKDKDYGW